MKEGGREGGREERGREREGGREGGREGEREGEGRREGGREEGREGRSQVQLICICSIHVDLMELAYLTSLTVQGDSHGSAFHHCW